MQLDPIAILVGPKGRGSNMAALARACKDGKVPAEVRVVIAPKEDIPAVENAQSMGLKVAIVPPEPLETYGQRLLLNLGLRIADPGSENLEQAPSPGSRQLTDLSQGRGTLQKEEGVIAPIALRALPPQAGEDSPVKWICLAGFTRLLPKPVLNAFPNHVLNIHPALLPKHGGKGMFGMKVHEAVLGSGDLESGCTVHFVNEQYDDGAIILQRRVPVLPNDTPEILAHRVLEQEHIAYAEALAKVIHDSRQQG